MTISGYGAIDTPSYLNSINDTIINNGVINANTANQTLTLGSAYTNWSNPGAINLGAGTLTLGGNFTMAGWGSFTRTAGTTVNLTGVLNNTVLDIGSAGLFKTGGINTFSGTILGGTLTNTDVVQTALNSSYGTLNGVTMGSNLALAGTAVTLNNLSVSTGSTLSLGSTVSTTQTGINNLGTLNLTAGTLKLGGSFTAANLGVFSRAAGTTVNLSGNLTNTGAVLDIGSAGLFKTGGLNVLSGTILGGTLSNTDVVQTALNSSYGTLNGVTIGSNLALAGADVRLNNLSVSAGSTLNLGSSVSTAQTGISNLGALNLTSGTLNLGGSFTAANLGVFSRSAGTTVNLTGTLTNTGATLDIGSAGLFKTGGLNALSGTILGGTLSNTDAVQTALISSYGTLDGVTLGSNLALSGAANIANSLKLAAGTTFDLGNSALYLNSGITQSIAPVSGSANLTLKGGAILQQVTGTNLTLGSGLIVSGYGYIGAGSSGNSLTNSAVINGNTTAQTLSLGAGGEVFSNLGTINLTAGTLSLGGTFAAADLGVFNRTAGTTVTLAGTLNNTGAVLDIGSAGLFKTGGLNSLSGTILNGTLSNSDAVQTPLNSSGTLDGVTTGSNLALSGTSYITNNLKLAAGTTLNLGAGNLYFNNAAAQSLAPVSGSASITMAGGGIRQNNNSAIMAQTLTLGAGLTISGYGTIESLPPSLGSLNNAIINNGIINANTANQTLTLGSFSTNWSNQGAINLTAGTLNLAGNFTTAGMGAFTRTAGTTVNLSGMLNNTGAVLDIGSAGLFKTGGINTFSGAIRGGTLVNTDAVQTALNSSNGTLYDMTLGSNLALAGTAVTFNYLSVSAGSTLNLGSSNSYMQGMSNLGTLNLAAGTLNLGGRFTAANLGHFTRTAGATVNLSGMLTNTGAVLDIGSAGLFKTGGINTFSGTILGGTLTNTDVVQAALNSSYGMLNGVTIGSNLALAGTGVTLDNLSVSAGSTLKLGSSFSTTQTGINNLGTINLTAGTLSLGGSFKTANLGNFTRTAGTLVDIAGTLDNTGATLDVGSAGLFNTGGLSSLYGTILGGTLLSTDASPVLGSGYGKLDGVTIGSNLTTSSSLYINNGITLASGVTVDIGSNYWYFASSGLQHIATTGTATLKGTWGGLYAGYSGMGQTLQIDSGVSLQVGRIYEYYSANIINNGSIAQNAAYPYLNISASNFTNNGTITAAQSGSLYISGTTFTNNGIIDFSSTTLYLAASNWSNAGKINLNSGTLNLGGTFATADLTGAAKFSRAAGTIVNLNGTLNNTGATLDIGSAGLFKTGGLNSLNGTILGGTLVNTDALQLTFITG